MAKSKIAPTVTLECVKVCNWGFLSVEDLTPYINGCTVVVGGFDEATAAERPVLKEVTNIVSHFLTKGLNTLVHQVQEGHVRTYYVFVDNKRFTQR